MTKLEVEYICLLLDRYTTVDSSERFYGDCSTRRYITETNIAKIKDEVRKFEILVGENHEV